MSKNLSIILVFLLPAFLFPLSSVGQDEAEWKRRADSITAGCKTSYEKAKAIYLWEVRNIEYDHNYKIYSAKNCWRMRKGVCQAYSDLFVALAKGCGVQAHSISGKCQTAEFPNGDGPHVWVAAKTEKGTILIDPTWGADDSPDATMTQLMVWFDVKPECMIFAHFPNNPKDQMLATPLTEEQYRTSYPDEDKRFAEIYTQRLPDLLKMEEQSLRMDIYEPLDRPENSHPLILLIHGGAFYNGDKQDITYEKWCRHFASLGYVAVSLNYRMGFLLPYKDAIDCAGYRATQDANAALRYLMHHADFYRINPDLVFTWGSSAGAITALNVAFLRDNNRPESVTKEGRIRKLITVAGASQHSLHVDEHRRIVPYFYTIQDTVARFFYTEIVPQPVNLQHESPQSPYFRINNTNVSEVHWKVEGGLLMETTDSRARVVFFKGAKHHTIRVCGKYKNGVEFCETMNV